eukprot:COSAG01_NODE_2049_length_8557_cov_2.690234_1_plen_105_part_00
MDDLDTNGGELIIFIMIVECRLIGRKTYSYSYTYKNPALATTPQVPSLVLGAEDPAPANARMPPWTADEVCHETKRDVLRWLQTHCSEDFIKSQRLSVRPGHAC